MCLEHQPPLYKSAPHRVAACYLYREAPVVKTEEMDRVFVTASTGAPSAGRPAQGDSL
jgi:hypothetical protein